MKNFTAEFKVGAFALLCIAGLLYMTLRTGKVDYRNDGYNVYAVFNELAGLQKKAPVMLNGVEVGKVQDIKFAYESDKTNIVLKLSIAKSAKIRQNPAISIKTLGLMGEKYIQITSTEGAEFIAPETILNGAPFTDMDSIMQNVKSISDEVKKLTQVLNGTVKDDSSSVSIIIKNLESASKNFEEFTADVKRNPWKLLFKAKEK